MVTRYKRGSASSVQAAQQSIASARRQVARVKERVAAGYKTRGSGSSSSRKITVTISPTAEIKPASTEKKLESAPVSEIRARKKPSGVLGSLGLGSDELGILETKKLRGYTLTPLEYATLLRLTQQQRVLQTAQAYAELPRTAQLIAQNPALLKEVPRSVKKSLVEFNVLLEESPAQAIVILGTDYYLMKGTGKAINSVSNMSKNQLIKLSSKYVGKAKTGSKLRVPTGEGRYATLKIVGKIPKEKIPKAIKRAGTRVTAVSSQADELLGMIRRKRVIRKPIPNEEMLSPTVKRQLKLFDEGKLSAKQIVKLDKAIRNAEVKIGFGGKPKGLLERSFFADPSGKIRPSRLGVLGEQEAKLMDYLAGDVTFRQAKPQILLFENVEVQKFPAYLKKVAAKLKAGKTLTKRESDALLTFQLQKSGKFKPLGFKTAEAEITLAPKEIIKKERIIGYTIVNKKKVPIIKASIYKPSKKIRDLITKFKQGKLSKYQIRKLDRTLRKETGFNYGLSSSPKTMKKYVNIKRIGLRGLRKTLSKAKPSKKTPSKRVSRVASRKPISRKTSRKVSRAVSRKSPAKRKPSPRPSGVSRITRVSRLRRPKQVKRITRITRITRAKRPITPVTVKKTLRLKGKLKEKKAKMGYYIYEKQGGKFKKIKGKPLTEAQAKDRLAFRLDNKLSRTAKLVSAGKTRKLGSISRKETGYFRKIRSKLRDYRIKKGKRIKLNMSYIEKRKRILDTSGEKKQLALNLRAKGKKRRLGVKKMARKKKGRRKKKR